MINQAETVPVTPADDAKPLDLVKRRPGSGHVEKIIELPGATKEKLTPSQLAFEVGEEARIKLAIMELDIKGTTPGKLKAHYTFGRVLARNGIVGKMVQNNLIKAIELTDATIKRFDKWLDAFKDIEGDPEDDELQQKLLAQKQKYVMQFAEINEKLLKAGILVPSSDVPAPTNNPFKAGSAVTPGATYVSTQNATFNTPPAKE